MSFLKLCSLILVASSLSLVPPGILYPASAEIETAKGMEKAESLPIVVALRFAVKPAKRQEFLRLMDVAKQKAQKEPGILTYNFFEESLKPNSFLIFIEVLRRKALNEHLAQSYAQNLLQQLPSLAEEAPDVRVFSISGNDFVLGM